MGQIETSYSPTPIGVGLYDVISWLDTVGLKHNPSEDYLPGDSPRTGNYVGGVTSSVEPIYRQGF